LPCSLSYNLKAELKTEISRTCENTLNSIVDSVEEELIYDLNNPFLNIIIFKQQELNNTSFLNNSYSYFPLNENELIFFNNFIYVTKEKLKLVFNKSLNQSDQFWLDCRLYRISASSKAHKIKTLKILTCEKQQSLAIRLLSSKSLVGQAAINASYGTETENDAFESYCKCFNVTVIKCGLIVHIKYPWLCASPDGIVVIDGIPKKVLEIKCPISCKDKMIIDPILNVSNVKYLQLINGKVTLKKSHTYYTQCQILMFTSGLDECDLYIFNFIEPVLINIIKDEHFLMNTLTKLEMFYFKFYLPTCVRMKNNEYN